MRGVPTSSPAVVLRDLWNTQLPLTFAVPRPVINAISF